MPDVLTGVAPFDAYLARVERALRPLPEAERRDMLRELAGHLQDALDATRDPALALERMGPAEAFAEALLKERLVAVDRRRSPLAIAGVILRAALMPSLVTGAVLTGLMAINTWYLYFELMQGWGFGLGVRLVALNLPAVVVFVLPIAALCLGMVGLPRLARDLSRPMFARVLPAVVAGLLLAGLAGAGLSFWLNDTAVIAANRQVVDLVRAKMGQSVSPEDTRSPQELKRAELRNRLDRRWAAAPARGEERDALMRDEVDYHYKLSLPALTFALTTLGVALGILLAGRVKRIGLLGVVATVLVVSGTYAIMKATRPAGEWLTPAGAAWMPFGFVMAMALLVFVAAWLVRGKERADVQA